MSRYPALAIIAIAFTMMACAPGFGQTEPDARPVKNLSPQEAKARVSRYVLPIYPESERPASLTRTVEIGVEISPTGELNDLRVLTGAPALAPAAWNAVRQWTFAPIVDSDAPIAARMRLLVRFKSDEQIEVLAVHPVSPDSFGDPGVPPNAPNTPSALIYGVRKPGQNGVGYPSCVSCPAPEFTQQARRSNVNGVVVLEVVITAQGSASNIRVVQKLGFGLDESAVAAVERWRFKPAMDAQGNPVETVTMLEIAFRLVRGNPF